MTTKRGKIRSAGFDEFEYAVRILRVSRAEKMDGYNKALAAITDPSALRHDNRYIITMLEAAEWIGYVDAAMPSDEVLDTVCLATPADEMLAICKNLHDVIDDIITAVRQRLLRNGFRSGLGRDDTGISADVAARIIRGWGSPLMDARDVLAKLLRQQGVL